MRFLLALVAVVLVCGVEGYNYYAGNMELKQAMDVAAIEAQNDGLWEPLIGKEADVSLPLFCTWDREFVHYPNPATIVHGGTLDDVLEKESITFAYVNATLDAVDINGQEYDALDTTQPQVTGEYSHWHNAMVQHLGLAYQKRIKITYNIYPSASAALQGVRLGEAHMAVTPWDLGGNFGGRRESLFLQGCPDHSKATGYLCKRPGDERFSSIGAFLSEQGLSEESPKIGVMNNAECFLYEGLYIGSEVTCVDEAEELTAGLLDGTFDLISLHMSHHMGHAESHVTERLPGSPPAVSYFGSLYRQDRCAEDEAPAEEAADEEKK